MTMVGNENDHTHSEIIPSLAIVVALAKSLMRVDPELKNRVLAELQSMKSDAKGITREEIEDAIKIVVAW